MKRRIISVGLAVLLVFSLCILPASAGGNIGMEDMVIHTDVMNELSAQVAINSYFTQRLFYLSGASDDITVVNRPMFRDEQKHKTVLEGAGIVLQSSVPSIISIDCWDGMAIATVQETAQFLKNGSVIEETITHEITMCCVEDNLILLQSDAYFESVSGFESCSYLSPEKLAEVEAEMMAVGSAVCICDKAMSQKDYTDPNPYYAWYETATGIWEYGEDWCAIFVAWCAAQSSISSSTIPYSAGVPNFRTHYYNWNEANTRYYDWQHQLYKKAQGQTYQWPQAGDLVFINGTASEPRHIGIICYVGEETLFIVDGNWNSKINYRAVPDTDSAIVAFAKPDYQNSYHTVSSWWYTNLDYHWNQCTACGKVLNYGVHRLTDEWSFDGSYHWHSCPICRQTQWQMDTHAIVWDSEYLGYRCIVCGYM